MTKIKTEEEFETKYKRLGVIFHAEKGTSEYAEAEILEKEIMEYDDKHYPLPEVSKEDMEAFKKDQNYKGNY